MPWANVPNSQIQLTRNWPLQGCYRAGRYMVWKAQLQGQAFMEHYFEGSSAPSLPVQFQFDPTSGRNERFEAQVQQTLARDLNGSFTLDTRRGQELVQAVRGQDASPRRFGTALSNCLAIKQKLRIAGQEFTVGIGGDRELCFFIMEVPLHQWLPEFPEFRLDGVSRRVRFRLTGNATLRFGPSAEGWRWLAQRVGRQIMLPLLRRLAAIVGRQVLRPIITYVAGLSAVTVTAVVGGVVGGVGLAYLTARFTSSARASGRHWAHCGQYAMGYVHGLWIRFDAGIEAQIADSERAGGSPRPGHTGDQIRLIGLAEALQDVDAAGGGIQGAQAARRELLRRLNLDSPDPRQRVVTALTDALRNGRFPRR